MSATITDINSRYTDKDEKLMAASSQIIRLEKQAETANEMVALKQAQVEALLSVSESMIAILNAVRNRFPVELLGQLDSLLSRSGAIVATVKAI